MTVNSDDRVWLGWRFQKQFERDKKAVSPAAIRDNERQSRASS